MLGSTMVMMVGKAASAVDLGSNMRMPADCAAGQHGRTFLQGNSRPTYSMCMCTGNVTSGRTLWHYIMQLVDRDKSHTTSTQNHGL